MSEADFATLVASWHDFYLMAGTSAATLIGLLFVGISINLDQITSEEGTGVRVLAEQAFANFVIVMFIALFVLIPGQERQILSVELAIVGTLGTVRVVLRTVSIRRRQVRPFGGMRYVVRRFGLSAVAGIGTIAVAATLPTNPTTGLYWLIGVVLIFLISAADSAWDLLIEVGRARRRAT